MADKNDLHVDSKFYFAASPFPATPQAESYCGIGSVEETRRRIKRSIERADGPSIVIGGPGLGKSLLCNMIANDYRSLYKVALLSEGQIDTSRELLQAIMFQLNLPYRDQEEGELRLALIDFLRPKENSGDNGTLLIVDEAQSLSSDLLEEIRMISSIVRDGKPRVRTLLAGGLRLDENLADPRLASFSQRVAARCYLHALSVGETAQYIRQQLERVGAEPQDLIRDEAISSVHSACDGIPRLINQLMNHVLYFAEQQAVEMITPDIVQAAWADLQQLPMPTRSAAKTPAASVVDFGPLDDDGETGAIEFGELSDFNANCETVASEIESPHAASDQLASDADELEPIDREEVVNESFEMIEACVQLVAEYERDHFAFDAGNSSDSNLADAFAKAFGVESVIAEGHEASDADRQPEYVLGRYEEEGAVAAESTESPTAEESAKCDSADLPASTTAGKLPISDDATSPCFRDFPVVNLSANAMGTKSECKQASIESSAVGSPVAPQTDPAQEANASEAAACASELDAETACFRESIAVIGDSQIADQVSTDVELNNVSDEPVTSEAAFGTIAYELWTEHAESNDVAKSVCSEAQPTIDQPSSTPQASQPKPSDPFGEGFDDEIAVEIHRHGNSDAQPVSVATGSPAPDPESNPVLWIGGVAEGNDPPEAEHEDLLRAEVISINRAAIDTNPGVVAGHFQGLQTRGHAAHANAKPKAARDIEVADDRDLLFIEDEVQEIDGIVPRPAVPAATKTLNDLTTLFSRIRKG